MESTHPENPALHDHLVTGETLFVTAGVLAFLSEVLITFRALVLPSITGAAVGLVCIVGTLYMVNWLYSGRREARQPALAWIGLQMLFALVVAALLFSRNAPWAYRPASWAHRLVATEWLAVAKFAAYAFFGYVIMQRTPALFFLRHR